MTDAAILDTPAPAALQRLAPYATQAVRSRGRLHPEEESATRTCFQRDRDRIIHSTAFRRLEYKTQVFVNHEGDHYRTRLTHSLEVAQLSRSLARELRLDEDLAEALALAHDLGHTPFGHAGEDALDEALQPYGGFDHNAHTIRVLTVMEQRYARFDGLNLTWETLEGVAKHNGPLASIPWALAEYTARHDLELNTWPGLEAQIAAVADDIAYNNHDIDDGLRAGLFTVRMLEELPLIGDVFRQVKLTYPGIPRGRLVHEAIRRLISYMVEDVARETRRRLAASGVRSAEEVRAHPGPLAGFSPEMQEAHRALKAFLMQNMYRHYRVNRMTSKARRMLKELFDFYMREPECLPPEWQAGRPGSVEAARRIGDFVAGMTDRFAMDEYHRLFDLAARS